MNVVFYSSIGKRVDDALAAALGAGVTAAGDAYAVLPVGAFKRPLAATDVAVLVGVKGGSRACFEAHLRAGKAAVLLDKGYTRLRGDGAGLSVLYWRASVDAFQPHAYLGAVPRPPDRWDALGLDAVTRPPVGDGSVLFCGSSQKYCDWHGLGDATRYATKVLGRLRRHTRRPLVYRPKPSWKAAVPIAGYAYSSAKEKFAAELARAHCVVTFGSNAAFEALLAGVPVVVLGDGIARPLAAHAEADVERVVHPGAAAVRGLAAAVAYCQWTAAELASGLAWSYLRQTVLSLHPAPRPKE